MAEVVDLVTNRTRSDKKTIPEWSVDSQVLYDRLRAMKQGEAVSYTELSLLIKKNVQKEGRGNLVSARRRALSLDRLVFEAIHNTGIRCMKDSEIPAIGKAAQRRVKRACRSANRKLSAVHDFNSLTPDQKTQHNLSVSILGAISQSLTEKKLNLLKTEIEEKQRKISYSDIMAKLLESNKTLREPST